MLDHEEEEEDASVVNSVVSQTHRSMIMLQIQVLPGTLYVLLCWKAAGGRMSLNLGTIEALIISVVW
jgi:hypothetical protein